MKDMRQHNLLEHCHGLSMPCKCVQVMLQRHNMLQRQVMLLRAASEPVTDEDRARLEVCRLLG